MNNQSAIKLANYFMFNDRTKHFEVDWHFYRQKIEADNILVEYIYCRAIKLHAYRSMTKKQVKDREID